MSRIFQDEREKAGHFVGKRITVQQTEGRTEKGIIERQNRLNKEPVNGCVLGQTQK